MSDSTFDFLQELDAELVQIGRSIEKIFYEDPHGVLIKSRLFAEHMSKTVAEYEDLHELKYLKQVDRVSQLDREGVFIKEVARSFDTIRTTGNRAAHSSAQGDLELALKIHKNLFKISVWFREVYGSHDFTVPSYSHPKIQKNEGIDSSKISELIESTLSKQLASILKSDKKQETNEESVEEDIHEDTKKQEKEISQLQEDKAVDDEEDDKESIEMDNLLNTSGKQLYGSSLLYELSKLKESSQEAVEGSDAFSSFKKYLHVDRPIQQDLIDTLMQTENKNDSQLIFLCGSVGDGKSHLIAYMNETFPDLMEKFTVHNDATESFDPQKNSLDTLAERLRNFSDDQIEKSNEKLILAINLGVLHNFLESDYVKESYTKLAAFIEKSKVFETDYVSDNFHESHFNLISFSDYHPYQLTKEGPQSDYFTRLLEKIVHPDTTNPFYVAYQRDLKEKVESPFMVNYRFLQSESVREKISQLLIQANVKHKYIISTRALLNFIHDILVPANIEEHLTSTSVIEDTQVLLPNILFSSMDRSSLLKVMSQLDPIHIRSGKIDQILIELNNSNDISKVFQKYLQLDGLEVWIDQLSDLGAFYELTIPTRQVLNASLIRFGYFLGSNLKKVYEDETYEKFMSYLYAYNVGIPAGLKDLYQETENAVFAWKGGPKHSSSYIYIDESLSAMNIAQYLELKPYTKNLIKRDEEIFNRFKNTIIVGFQDNNKTKHALLEIDYPLYETILKVLQGYRPNKKDKEDAIQFLEFVDKLMRIGKKEDELAVYDSSDDILFKLEYDEDFDEFSFKRE
ncbi:DNA phosphorothioation-dependent restriction protein DptF [Oceanobacillus salinisoli]|uniref:DNA phosphorothioation-dependent restriction protein DptF n=1 Tax=Oceanobacillus salinisoli TaxID=2678611 RepID=UPI0018CBF282|nr:DNA phosphorothioation-dependent restriction protein DptF [Oceanobacillus salinisoli]